jgi:hypothetical protein
VVLLEHYERNESAGQNKILRDRGDGQLHTAVLDLELFGAAHEFMGSVQSTFTFTRVFS